MFYKENRFSPSVFAVKIVDRYLSFFAIVTIFIIIFTFTATSFSEYLCVDVLTSTRERSESVEKASMAVILNLIDSKGSAGKRKTEIIQ